MNIVNELINTVNSTSDCFNFWILCTIIGVYEMNQFLETLDEQKMLYIKYNVASMPEEDEEQINCFTSMIIYRA